MSLDSHLNKSKMKKDRVQNYDNHIRLVPSYHYVTLGAVVVLLAGSTYYLITCEKDDKLLAGLFLLSIITLLSVLLHSRTFALKAQDRAIRAEENFRYFAITGKRFPHEISTSQIIALRFASDDELVALVERTVKENLSSKQIKQAVVN